MRKLSKIGIGVVMVSALTLSSTVYANNREGIPEQIQKILTSFSNLSNDVTQLKQTVATQNKEIEDLKNQLGESNKNFTTLTVHATKFVNGTTQPLTNFKIILMNDNGKKIIQYTDNTGTTIFNVSEGIYSIGYYDLDSGDFWYSLRLVSTEESPYVFEIGL